MSPFISKLLGSGGRAGCFGDSISKAGEIGKGLGYPDPSQKKHPFKQVLGDVLGDVFISLRMVLAKKQAPEEECLKRIWWVEFLIECMLCNIYIYE